MNIQTKQLGEKKGWPKTTGAKTALQADPPVSNSEKINICS